MGADECAVGGALNGQRAGVTGCVSAAFLPARATGRTSARNAACQPPTSRRDRGRRAHTASPHLRVIHLERGERPGEEIAGQARRALSVS